MMKWTKELPKADGYYWWRSDEDKPEIGYVTVWGELGGPEIIFPGEENPDYIEEIGGEWAGPIPEPEE